MTDYGAMLRTVPGRVSAAVAELGERALRFRPADGEWSAIEVCGHLVDKFEHWRRRVERTRDEYVPSLEPYDQDQGVLLAGYQAADLAVVLESLRERCEGFARVVAALPPPGFDRTCTHTEYGTITLRDCIELPLQSVDEHLAQIAAAVDASENA